MSGDWEFETRHIREWINGGGTPTDPLRKELALYLVRMSENPAMAVAILAEAMELVAVES